MEVLVDSFGCMYFEGTYRLQDFDRMSMEMERRYWTYRLTDAEIGIPPPERPSLRWRPVGGFVFESAANPTELDNDRLGAGENRLEDDWSDSDDEGPPPLVDCGPAPPNQ